VVERGDPVRESDRGALSREIPPSARKGECGERRGLAEIGATRKIRVNRLVIADSGWCSLTSAEL